MVDTVPIAIDAMGGDHGLSVTIPAALNALKQHNELAVILVGRQSLIEDALSKQSIAKTFGKRLSIVDAEQVVEMDELPSSALRNKKKSSLRIAINLIKEGRAKACVSAGNTGALMATARFVLKMLPGVDRPAIVTTLPTLNGKVRMLDLGANASCEPQHLYQFALMASELVAAVDEKTSPKIALLNIGEEEIKGNEQVKETAALLLKNKMLNYQGYAEGDDIYLGDADIIVCDGFVGNVSLKTSEGLAKMIGEMMKSAFKQNIFTRLMGLVAYPVLKAFKNRIDPRRYNGASFIGLKGTVIKSHGGADAYAFECAIHEALIEVEKDVPNRIAHCVVVHEGEPA